MQECSDDGFPRGHKMKAVKEGKSMTALESLPLLTDNVVAFLYLISRNAEKTKLTINKYCFSFFNVLLVHFPFLNTMCICTVSFVSICARPYGSKKTAIGVHCAVILNRCDR